MTYTQIVDGLPTTESFYGAFTLCLDQPTIQHSYTQALDSFQNSELGIQACEIALIELVAVACHQIAVYLFQNEQTHHKGEYEEGLSKEDKLEAKGSDKYQFIPKEPPVPFYHESYLMHQQYPYGIADIVGYWAEAKIFGGVVLFDRSHINGEHFDDGQVGNASLDEEAVAEIQQRLSMISPSSMITPLEISRTIVVVLLEVHNGTTCSERGTAPAYRMVDR
ncbi:hypothetical protein MAC_05173 [Metarhizium acridum CQMa 102]|uniref:Uncharacterized protein n=1 Tax=Metarhizium acridum (strain CQMa 102) TaxID=655827 RepID=E9E5M5_METAQ|nr:uncharacterized protein MAC_05173 [Metarhizium acridum CQMa 102]EFY88738.1 hypothetical protein MAC_05173 [Metarhizium acridum CQMa 102]